MNYTIVRSHRRTMAIQIKRDGRVVVRMQEEYTPKTDYEIAYENRR